jgi:uncharacterized Tic20 family protein
MTESVSHDERQWAMWANLGGLLVLANVPFANLAGALIVYFNTRANAMTFAHEHARRALNFQLTFSIVFSIFTLGWIGWWVVTVTSLAIAAPPSQTLPPEMVGKLAGFFAAIGVMLLLVAINGLYCVLGAVAALNGRYFTYPAIPFVR